MSICIQRAWPARRRRASDRRARIAARWQVFLAAIVVSLITAVLALGPALSAAEADLKANTSRAAREDALRSIPLEKLSPEVKAKVTAVLDNTSLYRRLPVQVVDCEPELFHFLVRQPEVVVNIWQVMGITNVMLERPDETHFRCSDGEGTTGRGEFVYRSHDTTIIYAEGIYEGPLFPRAVRGQVVEVLKTASIRETNGRYYVTTRLDTFLHVDNVGIEIIAKMFQGWLGRTVDHNFAEAVGFLGNISKAAENNPQSMRRLAAKLNNVDPEQRRQFLAITDRVAEKLSNVQLADGDERTMANVAMPNFSSINPTVSDRR